MNAPCDLSLVVPLYNEEACAERSISDLLRCLESSAVRYELLAVNNGSRDRTPAILEELAARWPPLRVLHFPENQGYGGAILAGLGAARGTVVGFTCGDGEVSPEAVVVIHSILRAGSLDLVKAKRIGRRDGIIRQLFSFGYHLVTAFLFRLHITDINAYPVLMTREAYGRIAPTARDWMINIDILSGARRLDLRTAELDVSHRERLAGRSHVRFWFPLLFLWQLIRHRFRLNRRFSERGWRSGERLVSIVKKEILL